ncbi:MAG: alanine--tRNA ligase [Bacteroidetes bacterium]|nr:alanine--tRNA ligase [Bacteroidota bacterium]
MSGSLEIKQQFLNFFASKGHRIVPSAPIVVKGDPTLMFTNAGMNQFKDYFLGNAAAPYTRVADTQKCLRVSGKHNDLEEVGHDHYHHTMFEMLGNWSFGDYFKKEAIHWAWELLTEVYQLPKDRLYVTVFEGDAGENLAFDQEAWDIWKELLPESRILKGNKKDNFWEMGDTGPCGPCTEIHYDGRSDADRSAKDGAHFVNADHPDVIEIWNNVFMEFNRKADKSLEPLPARHVDTGMGFERLVRIIQGKSSNYDTDIFSFIIDETAAICGKTYGQNEQQDIAFRVIADHCRAVSLCIADGQLPSNTGAGYVIRRILRRAVRYGFSYLGLSTPFVHKLIPALAEYFSASFGELKAQQDFVMRVIREEEASFFRTLSTGMGLLNQYFAANPGKSIDGKTAFELYDTFGFPLDLTQLIAREKGVTVDHEGFESELQVQKARSRSDANKETGDWMVLMPDAEEDFIGYDHLQAHVRISRYRTVKLKGKDQYQMVLNLSPFYAESGGQVGDTGTLEGNDGEVIRVFDTQKENKLHILICDKLPANDKQVFTARVDEVRRAYISNNHSATHLMHAALKSVLGVHVAQKGSLVNEEHLRFDFSHFSKMEKKEIERVEELVNEKIRAAIPLTEHREMLLDDAISMGATALFGEKYGDSVRVIVFDEKFSMELCGGTHVPNTSHIGLFKITAETSVAAGVRRIEAVTGLEALKLLNALQEKEATLAEMLGNPRDVVQAVEKLLAEKNELQHRLETLEHEKALAEKAKLLGKIQSVAGVNVVIEKLSLPNGDTAKHIAFQLKNEVGNLFCVLAYEAGGKPGIAVMISDELVAAKGWDASTIVRDLAKEIQGGGGGQKFFATAGGKDLAGLDRVVAKAADFIQ